MAVSSYSSSSWSELLPELLDSVFHGLNYAGDILNCATVCSSWRVSSSDVYSRKFLPFLFISHLSDEEETQLSDRFRVLSSANLNFSGRNLWVCGGTLGFLSTVTDSSPFEVYLQDPFTNTVTSLPPLNTFEDVQQLLQYQATVPGFETLIKNLVKKAVSSKSLVEPDWVVLIIYNTDGKLAFCRRGDKHWKDLESDHVASSVDDIVFCNGVFFAIDRMGHVYYCEIDPNNPNPKAVPLCKDSPFRYDPCKKYFTESDYGKLWVVLKKVEVNDDCDFTDNFEIYEFESETKSWTMVRSLRGKALFLSTHGRCIAVLAGETGSRGFIKDNSVYFVDGNDANLGSGSLNLSVFEWESKQTRKLYQPKSWNCDMFWVTPTDVLRG